MGSISFKIYQPVGFRALVIFGVHKNSALNGSPAFERPEDNPFSPDTFATIDARRNFTIYSLNQLSLYPARTSRCPTRLWLCGVVSVTKSPSIGVHWNGPGEVVDSAERRVAEIWHSGPLSNTNRNRRNCRRRRAGTAAFAA